MKATRKTYRSDVARLMAQPESFFKPRKPRFAIARNGEVRRLHRQTTQGKCEKCNAKTWWTVNVAGRQAYWCGCP